MIVAAAAPPPPMPYPVIPCSVLISTMIAPPNCANGPIQRDRAGSKSELNCGTVPPFMPGTFIGYALTEVIWSRSAPYAEEAAAAADECRNLRRESGMLLSLHRDYRNLLDHGRVPGSVQFTFDRRQRGD